MLGDSLSDFGNLASEGVILSPNPDVYTTSRFSNGPVWNEDLISDFLAEGKAADNFADGGATISLNRTDPGMPTDLAGQLVELAYAAPSEFDTSPLVSMWFGANDLFWQSPVTRWRSYAFFRGCCDADGECTGRRGGQSDDTGIQ